VGSAFGWDGPVARLTVRQLGGEEGSFAMNLDRGLNMISLPLMPSVPYTASKLAEEIGATVVIKFDSAAQRFVGFAAGQEGDGFSIDGGKGYIVNVPEGGTFTFVGKRWTNAPGLAFAPPGVDVPLTAWALVASGDLRNTEAGATYTVVAKNLRTGAVATDSVSSDRGQFAAVWADLSRKSVVEAGDTLELILLDELENIVSGPFRIDVDVADIRKAYLSLPLTVGDVHPGETLLAQNFPNPFNPETWIPYQLSEPADVTIQIFNLSGHLVRTLNIGFRPTGFYTTRSAAAYWDGRNNVGERIASGVYFYTLQTQSFAATRKMLISK
jgi:hypothetical protein